jgi:hypothetical protein
MTVTRVQPVPRTLCLTLSDDRSLPLQCRFKLDHSGGHDWEIERGLAAVRAELEQDTPSGVLPVRVPGAALGDAVVWLGPGDLDEDGRPAESIVGRPVIARWVG